MDAPRSTRADVPAAGLCAIAAASVFLVDLLTPRNVVGAVLYVGVVAVAAAFVERRVTTVFAAACTILTVLAYAVAPGSPTWTAAVNRACAIAIVWFVARFVGREHDVARHTRHVAQHAPYAIVLADGARRLVYVNPAAARLFGYERGELEGRRVEELMPSRFRGEHVRAFASFADAGAGARTVSGRELRGLCKDGREFPLEMQLTAFTSEEGTLVLAHIIDLTEQRRFAELSEQMATVLDSSGDAIVGTDLSGRILTWNAAAEALYGYTAAEAIGADATTLNVPESRRAEVAAMAAALAGGVHLRRFETERMRKDGSLVDVSVSVSFVANGGGRPVGTLTVAHDISERKKAENELRAARDELEARVRERTASLLAANTRLEREIGERHKAQAELRRSERLAAIGTLSAGIAHELNNPLGLITLELAHARDHAEEPRELRRSLAEIEKEARRCANIVDKVLGFARRQASAHVAADLNEAAARARDVVLPSSRKAGVGIVLELACDLPRLTMNPVDIEQVLVNLIDNAVHATDPGGEIRLVSDRSGRRVRVHVIDSGRGMTETQLAHACEPFYTTRIREGGTGLGLSICHGIVASHGGSMRIESRPGVGTTITLEFPVDDALTTSSPS